MKQKLNWDQDPVVLLEKAVHPIVSVIPTILVRKELGDSIDPRDISAPFDKATHMLRRTAIEMLRAQKIPFRPDEVAPLADAANVIETFGRNLILFTQRPPDRSAKMELLGDYTNLIVNRVESALDAFRAVFISFVLDRQWQHAQRADEAIERLDKISKQIFFISINASVEAARVGDMGRGFQQISTDIRALSQSAQDATRDLSDIVVRSEQAI